MKDEYDYNFISITRCCRAEKRYEIIINTDSEEHYKATQDFAHKLIDHAKPTTNADRIRAMSDKELAELMRSMMDCDSCGNMFSFKCDGSYEHCLSVCLNWLQMPSEEEDDHD